jgi:hypothetical protein
VQCDICHLRKTRTAGISVSSRHSHYRRLKTLDDGHVGPAATLAHRLQSIAFVFRVQSMDQCRHQLGTSGAKWMAECDAAAIDIKPLRTGARMPQPGLWNRRKGATPTECLPFFGMPLSSTIKARIGPWRAMIAGQVHAPPPAPRRPTIRLSPRSGAAIGGPLAPAQARHAPPSARRFCDRLAAVAPCNTIGTAPLDRHARARILSPRHRR